MATKAVDLQQLPHEATIHSSKQGQKSEDSFGTEPRHGQTDVSKRVLDGFEQTSRTRK